MSVRPTKPATTRKTTPASAPRPASKARAAPSPANVVKGAANLFERSVFGPIGGVFGGIGNSVESLVARGLKLAAGVGDSFELDAVRHLLDRVLGKSAKDEIGWLEKEGAPTKDTTPKFKALYADAKAGKAVLPADAKNYVYLTLRGYTGDNWPTYMKANRDGLSRRGLDVREITRDTEATVETNAKVVRDAILKAYKETGKQVVLIGHSKGGMDMTAAVALYPELNPLVRAAVGLQAPYGGVPAATDITDKKLLGRIAGEGVEWLLGGDDDSIGDFSYSKRKAFVRAHPWPTDIPTVSLSTSSSSQFNGLTPTINWYKLRYGEKTDGIVASRDTEIPGSNVVRLDNLDHLNSVMPEWPGRANYDPGLLTEALVALALTTPSPAARA